MSCSTSCSEGMETLGLEIESVEVDGASQDVRPYAGSVVELQPGVLIVFDPSEGISRSYAFSRRETR